ncbi:MAG: Gfo/Idh/MocA family oxidoreductase [Acidobacteria bacterium]|nr:Gfo/Idh/MocA family oxidoreductase [Acidobacteriota bacterium]MBV9474678.1 Gfo/Idh/MocA family oxidoreductase [Acidobacteriota bacterium]
MRAGVVGTGYLGRLHARVLTEIPDVTAVGFVEPNDAIASEIASTLNLRRFASVAALAKEIDCAVVATPTTTHFDVARELLASGCDVLVEKPITATADQARQLIALASEHGRVVQVGHVERYNPAITAVAELVGASRYVVAERLGVFVPRSLDVDVLLDLMIHDLNLVLSLLRQDVVDVRAVGVPVLTDKVDITNVRLELANGAVANLTASRVSQERVRKQRFFGSDFYISVDTKEQEVKGYRLVDDGGTREVRPLQVNVEKKEPLRAELEAFLACVRDRTRPIVAAEDGLAAVELALRVRDAIDEAVRNFKA